MIVVMPIFRYLAVSFAFRPGRWLLVLLLAVGASAASRLSAGEESLTNPKKHIIGATAVLTEVSSGLPFAARVDTGAHTCSLHVEKIEIKDESKKPLKNIGKTIRFLIKNEKGQSEWVEAIIASVVRVHSSALKEGDFDRRYKVRLTLAWGEVRKEVLVTLNDRTHMDYPLLVGRNFLRHDFLVDVDIDNRD
jgi:hypothetical protein